MTACTYEAPSPGRVNVVVLSTSQTKFEKYCPFIWFMLLPTVFKLWESKRNTELF